MEQVDAIRWIAYESERFATQLDAASLDQRVPACPQWALRDLAWHLGRVQRSWASVARAGSDLVPTFPPRTAGPTEAGELQDWIRASTCDLLDALRDTAPDTPAWTWWPENRTVGAIARHQVQEVAVHRRDAEASVGTPCALEPPVADDGVEEFVWIARQLRDPAPILLVATDSGRSAHLSDKLPTTIVSATASDLVLLLYGRITTECVRVDGDRATLDRFLVPIE